MVPAHGGAAEPEQAPGAASPARPKPPPGPQRLGQSPQARRRPAKEASGVPSHPVDLSSGSSEAFESELGPLGRSLDAAGAGLLRHACQVSAQPKPAIAVPTVQQSSLEAVAFGEVTVSSGTPKARHKVCCIVPGMLGQASVSLRDLC